MEQLCYPAYHVKFLAVTCDCVRLPASKSKPLNFITIMYTCIKSINCSTISSLYRKFFFFYSSCLVQFRAEFLRPPFCKVSREKLLTRQNVFPLSGKVLDKYRSYGPNIFPSTEISSVNKRAFG